MRSASPFGYSNWRDRKAQIKAASPAAPRPSDTGIRMDRISIVSFQSRSRSAFSVTVMELSDIARAAISGVTIPATANGTATIL